MDRFHRALRVQTTQKRRELGNVLVDAPTRGGKGLLGISQILTWPHSIIINDIKGDLFKQTAGYRNRLGPLYVFDPDGYGNQYDPLLNRLSNRDLISSATDLLDHVSDQEIIFTQRAIVMLTQLFLAARLERRSLLPFVQEMIGLGLIGVSEKLEMLSRLHNMQPNLATKFLDVDIDNADFKDKFLLSCWGTLKPRMELLLADPTVRCFNKPDFTGKGIITSKTPITVYLRWPERDLHALSPIIRLVWKSLIDEMMDTYDNQNGEDCHPVLLLVDEAGRTAIPSLADHATTVNGRGISLWVAIQSLSQLDAVYGRSRAQILRDNMESQIYYRPCNQETADYLQKCLGNKSGFAHSDHDRSGN
jgi:type IV secretion system protein VirD4